VSENGSENHKPPPLSFRSRLTARLNEAGLVLWPSDKLADLWKASETNPPPKRAVIEEPSLRIGGYLDLDPDLLIVDSELGTLGLVYRLQQEIEARARTIIDQATYLRHLLVMDAGVDARPQRRPYTVECVLSFASQDAARTLKEVFRNTARDTSFWHAIGANVLVCGDDQEISPAGMSRAFSWLLAGTRRWFNDPPQAPPAKVLSGISLTNYRLPGTRTLMLQPQVKVHLLHGQNGAGKSSIAEALELSVTGSVARLKAKNVSDYAAVIQNRHTTQAAGIQLQFDPPETWSSVISASGVSSPLSLDIPVSRFRLDEDGMDTLAREGSEKRAEIFLRSFFPEDADVHITLDKARETLDNILRTLPPEIQSSMTTLSPDQKPDEVQRRFGWLEESRPPTREECRDCEPLSREALEVLRVFAPEIGVYLDTAQFRDTAHFDEVFKGLNEALERVRARASVWMEAIRAAQHCFSEERVRNWSPSSDTGAVQDWLTLLERWSEQIALADLAEKHWQIAKTLSEAARASGKECLELANVGLFIETEKSLSSTLAGLEQLRKKSAELRDKVHLQAVEFSKSSAGGTAKSGEQPHITDRQMRALNLAGETLTSAGVPSAFGDFAGQLGSTIDQAFTQNKPLPFAGVVIGSTGWAEQLSAKLEAVAKALAPMVNEGDRIETRSQSTASYVGPVQRKDTLKAALAAGKAVKEAAKKTEAAFLNEIHNQSFNAALNELMALFTPARWAYDDVEVKQKSVAGRENLELAISGAKDSQADLLLNTAELNVFTVALYLLAATRVGNPLGMLLFDDPLQNMDELTVTTLARGLAKVLQVFPAKWQLAFLFHGEDDLERFRQEVPAAVYLLPWLAPAAASEDQLSISAEPLKSTFDSELQNLGPIIKMRNAQQQVGAALSASS
jgi:hypothetical protein